MRHRLASAEAEKKRMAAEMAKLSHEHEANLTRFEELKSRLSNEAQAHAQERDKLQKRFDADYSIFLERRGEFNESQRLRCVFCPQDNQVPLSSFLFHVAREHMFDQVLEAGSIRIRSYPDLFLRIRNFHYNTEFDLIFPLTRKQLYC